MKQGLVTLNGAMAGDRDTVLLLVHVTKTLFIVLDPPQTGGLNFPGVHMSFVVVLCHSFSCPMMHLFLRLMGWLGPSVFVQSILSGLQLSSQLQGVRGFQTSSTSAATFPLLIEAWETCPRWCKTAASFKANLLNLILFLLLEHMPRWSWGWDGDGWNRQMK